MNIPRPSVVRRPRVAIAGTGDELTDPGKPLKPGAIRDSNGPALGGAVHRAGGELVARGRGGDDHEATLSGQRAARRDAVSALAGVHAARGHAAFARLVCVACGGRGHVGCGDALGHESFTNSARVRLRAETTNSPALLTADAPMTSGVPRRGAHSTLLIRSLFVAIDLPFGSSITLVS
jgi:hypothetical protein